MSKCKCSSKRRTVRSTPRVDVRQVLSDAIIEEFVAEEEGRPVNYSEDYRTALASMTQNHNARWDYEQVLTDEDIRTAAYFKWLDAGCPEGDGVEFWLQAKEELTCCET